jgi:formylglycine-generating enzyme
MREDAVTLAARPLVTARPAALLLVLVAIWVGACNAITGASGYATVATCTGPVCSLECAAQGGTWKAGGCVCGDGSLLCGGSTGSCCGGTAPHCVTTSSGVERCSACTKAAYECGAVCCEEETCLSAALGSCGTAYGKAGRSCAGGLICPVPVLEGTVEDADCCESIALPGGTFPMGLSATGPNRCPETTTCDPECTLGGDEVPQHPVTLAPYMLDRFEVTVGRFRTFVDSWDYLGLPDGAGGDAVVAGSGWRSAWNVDLPASKGELENDVSCQSATGYPVPQFATWTSAVGSKENFPITCVTWYEAFAFCAWDGGRLPTEAEWEFAAANGSRADLYPWGEDAPTPELALYCGQDQEQCLNPLSLAVLAVGSLSKGANRWGNRDLAGNVGEWVLDTWAPYPTAAVTNYADVASGAASSETRVYRGGDWTECSSFMRAASRQATASTDVSPADGFRCAKSQ